MTHIEVLDYIEVCPNCINYLANGFDGMDLTPVEELAIELGEASLVESWDGPVHIVAHGVDSSFSWSPCDMCNGLAGDRYTAAILSK